MDEAEEEIERLEHIRDDRSMRQHCALKHGIVKEFLAEFLGTFVLVLFGCGSVAQTVLSRNTLGEPLTVHIGFSVGLMMAAYVAGGVSGGHVNPAVSLAMVILGKLKIWKFPFYVIAQFLGAFAGAAAVFGLYYDAFMDFTSGILSVTGINATGHIFASYPARHLSILGGFIDQVVGTGMLVLCILAIIDGGNIGAPKGVEPLAIGLIIMAIGVSMGLNCGYPLNPARDLGPRLFTAVAGWGMEVFRYTAGYWWWIPVAGPMVGGVIAAVIYYLLIELHHHRDEPDKPHEEEEDSLKDKYEMITMS
uniref:Aquaporin 9b n=1 Tax=Mola mola TaxID=94237 RepID=A0A3Q3X4C6_MOLML